MIIPCGKRRLVSYRYGWMIQIQRHNKITDEMEWREDRPAYPANLAQACEMLCERVLTDADTCEPDDLVDALRNAARDVKACFAEARAAAEAAHPQKPNRRMV